MRGFLQDRPLKTVSAQGSAIMVDPQAHKVSA